VKREGKRPQREKVYTGGGTNRPTTERGAEGDEQKNVKGGIKQKEEKVRRKKKIKTQRSLERNTKHQKIMRKYRKLDIFRQERREERKTTLQVKICKCGKVVERLARLATDQRER